MVDEFHKFYYREKERIDRERSLIAVSFEAFQEYQREQLAQCINAYARNDSDDLDKYYDYEVEEEPSMIKKLIRRIFKLLK